MEMADIETILKMVCDSGARAMRRYAEVSGESPDDMPEYFMPAFIMHELGDTITATLETGFSKLSRWNREARERRGLGSLGSDEEARLLTLAEAIGSQRVDMVLYTTLGEDVPKQQQDFLALVEFKRGWPSRHDRNKLLRLLPHIDTCPFGIVSGSLVGDHEWHKKNAAEEGDCWWEAKVEGLDAQFFCARLFRPTASLSKLD